MRFSIKAKIVFLCGIFLIILTVSTLLLMMNSANVFKSFRVVVHDTENMISESHLLAKLVVDMETGQRGFIITGEESFLEPFDRANKEFDDVLANLREDLSGRPKYLKALEEIEHLRYKWLGAAGEPEIQARRQVNETKVSLKTINRIISQGTGKQILDNIRAAVDVMSTELRATGKKDALILLTQLSKDVVDSETGQRGFLLAGKDRFLEPYYYGQLNFDKHAKELEVMLDLDKTNLEKLSAIKSLYEEWLVKAARPEIQVRIDYEKNPRSMDDVAKLLAKKTGKNIIDQLRKVIGEFTNSLGKDIEGELSRSERSATFANFISFMIGGIGICSAFLLSFFLSRSIIKPIIVMQKGTEIIGDGDLTHKIALSSKDELSDLAESFNKMTDNLKNSKEALSANNQQLQASQQHLRTTNQQLKSEITERKQVAEALRENQRSLHIAHKKMLDTSYMAGMAEVASNVLHNVKNVLNSLNVSTSLITETITNSQLINLKKTMDLIDAHSENLGDFLTADEKGKQIPLYLNKLSEALTHEQNDLLEDMHQLTRNVDHLKEIINAQQSYAKVVALESSVSLEELVADALKINQEALEHHGIKVKKDFAELSEVTLDKQKTLQILVNLISNAKNAFADVACDDKWITIRCDAQQDILRIEVADNGIGISKENMIKIFNHGFTTKKEGHGFGLHSAALAAKEMKGTLSARSEGPGQGATFTLEIPYKPAGHIHEKLHS